MKKLILLIALFISSIYSYSQCQSGDCKNGYSKMKYSDGTYEGFYKDGKLDSLGLMFYADKRTYHGEFKNNNYNGNGYYKWESGSSYFGKWKNGLQSGLGIEKNSSGTIVSAGEFLEGKISNPLSFTSPTNNPKNCTGNCVDGIGKFMNADSTYVLGIFKNKQIVLGYINNKNILFDGEIKNNIPHGFGQIKYLKTNEYFMGYFKNGKKHGVGIYTDKNSKRIFGEWIDDKYQDPTKFKYDKKDFCNELIALAKLSKKERHGLKIKEKHSSSTTLEKQFLNQFKLKSDSYADDFSGKEKIFFYFPNKNENKPTIVYEELIEACKSCKKLTSSKESYFKYKDVELYVGKYTSGMTLTFPKPDPCISGNCKNGKGKKQYTTSVYEGSFKDGKTHGKGKEVWDSGNIYEGEYKNDMRNGVGTFFWKVSGNRHEGEYKDGLKHGKGVFNWSIGDKYEGDFVSDSRTGNGTYMWKNGNSYTGNFLKNKRTGQGTFTWANGSKRTGEYKDDKTHGFAKEYGKDGKLSYEGNWVNNKFEGNGTRYYSDGKYIGGFKDDLRQGIGKFYNLNGILTFEGQYKDDKANGKGVSYYTSGKKSYEGNYENGVKNGQGTKYYTDGKYLGEFKDGLRHGTGKFYNLEGKLTFEGQYKDDKTVK